MLMHDIVVWGCSYNIIGKILIFSTQKFQDLWFNSYRFQIEAGDRKRHAHLQKCRHSRREQSHPKIKEGEGQVGVVKARGEVKVVECKEVRHNKIFLQWCNHDIIDYRLGWWAWRSQRWRWWLAGSLGIWEWRPSQTAREILPILTQKIVLHTPPLNFYIYGDPHELQNNNIIQFLLLVRSISNKSPTT